MIELNPDTVRFIADKAREFQIGNALDLPQTPVSLEIDAQTEAVFAEHAGNSAYQELLTTIEDLEPDQQVSLVALMWLGRGDFALDEWVQALTHAGAAHNSRTAQYLIATPLLADYLEEGLAMHGYEGED